MSKLNKAFPIGSLAPLNVGGVNVYTAPDKSIWLKSGVIETDFTKYPNYPTSYDSGFTGITKYIGTETETPADVCCAFGYLWVLSYIENSVFKYDLNGNYTGESFSLASGGGYPIGLGSDGTYFWVSDYNTKLIYKYNSDGSYANFSKAILVNGDYPNGICWDGTHYWVSSYSSNYIEQFDTDWVSTGIKYSTASTDSLTRGLGFDGEYLWVVGDQNNAAYKYDIDGTFANAAIMFEEVEETIPVGIAFNGEDIWAVGRSQNTLLKYGHPTSYIGINQAVHPDTGFPIYLRVG